MPSVLYLPIYEPGSYHDRALANKHGLRTAFEAVGDCFEWDYLAYPREKLYEHLYTLIEQLNPTLIFTQFQGADTITPEQLRLLRHRFGVPIVNWNGDYWPHGLTSPEMLALLREIDLQLVVNASVLDTYRAEGVRAAFWPFGFETPNRPLPAVRRHDVVYLANAYHEWRNDLYHILRAQACDVGVYGSGWPQNEGECTYDFTYGEALYRSAKIAVSDNRYTDARGYLSNRPFQAMAAGCFVLQQYVADLEPLTGFIEGVHYVGFKELGELPDLITHWLSDHAQRERIAARGQRFVMERHSWEARVKQLFDVLLPEVSRVE